MAIGKVYSQRPSMNAAEIVNHVANSKLAEMDPSLPFTPEQAEGMAQAQRIRDHLSEEKPFLAERINDIAENAIVARVSILDIFPNDNQ